MTTDDDRIPIGPGPDDPAPPTSHLQINRHLVARARAWAERSLGKMSGSAAIATVVRLALPILEAQQSREDLGLPPEGPDVWIHNTGDMFATRLDAAEAEYNQKLGARNERLRAKGDTVGTEFGNEPATGGEAE